MQATERLARSPDKNYGAAIARCLGTNRKHKGTGFRVGTNYVLTCAHVVKQCLGISKKTEDVSIAEVAGKTMEINFPISPNLFLTVEIVADLWRWGGEDLAILKLTQPLPVSISILSLKQGKDYWHHHFAVFGFPEECPEGRFATGELMGELPGLGRIQAEGTKEQGMGIQEGFSGSPVWDEEQGGVVGMTVARDENEATKIGFMIPYEKLNPVLEAISLFALLLPEETKLAPHWKIAYQLVEPSNIHEVAPKTLQEAILKVLDMTDRNGYRAIAQFVGYFALQSLGLNIPSIREWLESQNINVSELLQNIGQRLSQQAQQKGSPHLLFCVETDHNSDRFNIRAYLVKDSNNPKEQVPIKAPEEFLLQSTKNKATTENNDSFKQLEEILQNCLEECVEIIGTANKPDNIRVEIFLPFAKLDLKKVYSWTTSAISDIELYPETVGCRYQKVLRLSERLNRQIHKPQMEASWWAKWDTLQKIQCQAPCKGFVSDKDENGNFRTRTDLTIKLRQSDATGLSLSRMPHLLEQENPLGLLISSGVPIAIWLDPNCLDFTEILNCFPIDLPRRVQEKHRAAWECTSPGAEIGLIWEDPNLIPFISPSNLQMAGN
jgi:hypothetical protein